METPITVLGDTDVAPYHLLHGSDDSRLNQLGYKQELRRSLSGHSSQMGRAVSAYWNEEKSGQSRPKFVGILLRFIANFSVTFSIISVLTGITTLYSQGLTFGGPVTMVYGWPVVGLMTLIVGLSLAEICSAYPTSGGLYFWSAKLCGNDWGPFASWLTGW
ncbi:hypothetical protein DH2020_020707 [Rehmannia glutinosa]|uniref:Uncharacterized protein n=1 Tax=Rehmannia glutinosa TaxID=99300 RepID=A0ABR0WIZ5_REHGL